MMAQKKSLLHIGNFKNGTRNLADNPCFYQIIMENITQINEDKKYFYFYILTSHIGIFP